MKGYTQNEGVDFLDTFSSIATLVLVKKKKLLSLAATQNWFLSQLDISNAFLNGDLYVEVYMEIPLGYANCISPFMYLNKLQGRGI